MLRVSRLFQSMSKVPVTTQAAVTYHPAPKLHPGELQQFRYEREKQVLYEGYNEEELFGIKYGIKHSKEMRTEMLKDTIAMAVLFLTGATLIIYNHQNFRKNMVHYERYINSSYSKQETIPDHAKTYPGVRKDIDPKILHEKVPW